jgi:hypothetical protein
MNTLQEMKEIIEAAIAGKTIQVRYNDASWVDSPHGRFDFRKGTYRVKPEPKPDVVRPFYVDYQGNLYHPYIKQANLLVTIDGETGELKSAEVLK